MKTIPKNVYAQSISERVLLNPKYSTNFTCNLHRELSEKLAARIVVNMFFHKKQKHTNQSVRQEQVVDFKKGQRKKE